MIKYLALLMLLLSFCGPPPNPNFLHMNIIDTNEFIIDSTMQVMADINTATRCEIFGSNRNHNRREIYLKEDESIADNDSNAVGLFNGNTNTIYILPEVSGKTWLKGSAKQIITHEIGHALGLGHVDGTVMAKQLDPYVTYDDGIKQLAQLLEDSQLNPCDFKVKVLSVEQEYEYIGR